VCVITTVYSRNCIYQTAYHVVWCPKYRKPILTGNLPDALKSELEKQCAARGWEILSIETQPDHVHLFVSFPPAVAIAEVVKILKGTTARKLFSAYPLLRNSLWSGHLWSPSYYVGTAGNVSTETIRAYIERTEHIKGRR